jgi:hypothetical protein
LLQRPYAFDQKTFQANQIFQPCYYLVKVGFQPLFHIFITVLRIFHQLFIGDVCTHSEEVDLYTLNKKDGNLLYEMFSSAISALTLMC